MRNILLTLTISIIFLSCKKENNYENDTELCTILAEMIETDQSIRKLPELNDPFFEILDSIRKANNLTLEIYSNLSTEEQLKWGKIAREIAEKRPKGSKKVRDSLWQIQTEIDRKNTKLLIDITKKRGWVSKDGLGCTEYIAPVIIFRHAPEEYWEKIKPLIDKEYAEKRMGSGDYEFIDNHLRGRPLDWNPNNKNEKSLIKTD
ncbi:hypothetical protein BUL40_09680 [Croceivirga radicis]|uniref:Lipoprotein n=1 Tax=Croceivirga radicis TaxID=1929488 RepID=A0A1V6LRV5_9FLAO|nr:hypothetical protein [Croceivirga radicis]OQD42777.1 hypothetical protein BUL40_09680 [Croceivirga radicis]